LGDNVINIIILGLGLNPWFRLLTLLITLKIVHHQ
jgi:hypothetical protein